MYEYIKIDIQQATKEAQEESSLLWKKISQNGSQLLLEKNSHKKWLASNEIGHKEFSNECKKGPLEKMTNVLHCGKRSPKIVVNGHWILIERKKDAYKKLPASNKADDKEFYTKC